MMEVLDRAKKNGDCLGGVFEITVLGCPPGLGTFASRDRTLDGALAQALMSIQAIKGVEVGLGFNAARRPGSAVRDEIFHSHAKGYFRKTNNAGGMVERRGVQKQRGHNAPGGDEADTDVV